MSNLQIYPETLSIELTQCFAIFVHILNIMRVEMLHVLNDIMYFQQHEKATFTVGKGQKQLQSVVFPEFVKILQPTKKGPHHRSH